MAGIIGIVKQSKIIRQAVGPVSYTHLGSGPTPRNGNTNNYLYLAQELEKAGIATLRYDKRGIGSSKFCLLYTSPSFSLMLRMMLS